MKNDYDDDFDDFDSMDFVEFVDRWDSEPEVEEGEEESVFDLLNVPYSELKSFPKSFHVYDVILAKLYGRMDIQTGIHSRFAEKVASHYLSRLGFTEIVDSNVTALLQDPQEWKQQVYDCPFDVTAEYNGCTYFFDVKSQQNTAYKGFWHDLSGLIPGENILYMRTAGEVHNVSSQPVGYILYPVLDDLFKINKKYMKKMPSFLFFNNSLSAFFEYAQTHDPLEVPLMLEEIVRSKKFDVSFDDYWKIAEYVSVSRNEDAFALLQKLPQHSASRVRKRSA